MDPREGEKARGEKENGSVLSGRKEGKKKRNPPCPTKIEIV
jgi:hypothetical protein